MSKYNHQGCGTIDGPAMCANLTCSNRDMVCAVDLQGSVSSTRPMDLRRALDLCGIHFQEWKRWYLLESYMQYRMNLVEVLTGINHAVGDPSISITEHVSSAAIKLGSALLFRQIWERERLETKVLSFQLYES